MFHHGFVKEYRLLCPIVRRIFSSSKALLKDKSKVQRKFLGMQQAKNTGKSKKGIEFPSTPCHIRITVIGCGTHGNPRALSLEASDKLYLFNCGDGTQKLMGDLKSVSSSKIDHVFVTQLSWANVGGIYGKTLGKKESINNCGTNVTIHGANEMVLQSNQLVVYYVNKSKSRMSLVEILKYSVMFSDNPSFSNFFVYKDELDGTFEDAGLLVEYVPLSSTKRSTVKENGTKFEVRRCHLRKIKDESLGFLCVTRKTESGNFIGNVTQDSSADLSGLRPGDRIIEINSVNVEELPLQEMIKLIQQSDGDIEVLVVDRDCHMYCKDKGIAISSSMEGTDDVSVRNVYHNSSDQPFTEIWTDIRPVMGYIVKFKEDRVRVKKEVLNEHGIKPGPFCKEILEGKTVNVNGITLTPEMLLEEREIIRPVLVVDCPSEHYLDSLLEAEQFSVLSDSPNTVPQLVVHFTPSSIYDSPRYQLFLQRFDSEGTSHLILNDKSPPVVPIRQLTRHLVMNKIHPEIFPLLHYDETIKEQEGHVIQGVNNLQYIVKPRKQTGFSWTYVPDLNPEVLLKKHFEEIKLLNETNQVLKQVQNKCKVLENSSQEYREYPVITFLGTGSAVPSLYRSQSCILIETRKDEFIILDCGEASLMQLYLKFGDERAEEILSNLKAVFISHLHFDHHGGLTAIALRRQEVLEKQKRFYKLMLIIPDNMKKWLITLSEHIYDTDRLFETIPMMSNRMQKKYSFDVKAFRRLQDVLNVEKFTAVPVDHVKGSFGVHIKHNDGWTLMYSGDTRPCDALVKQGYEDTDFLIHEASFSNAETSQAFTKRHSTIEQAVGIGKKMKAKHVILTHFSQRHFGHPVFEDLEDGVAFAYDFMQLKPQHVPLVTHLKPALAVLLVDEKIPANVLYADDVISQIQEENRTTKRENTDSNDDAPSAKEPKLDVESV